MLTFILIVLMMFLIPGPAVFITVSQTMKGGKKSGLLTALGIAVGDFIHTIAAVVGLSAILMTSALAFEIVKYVGAAYLIFLGVKAFIQKTEKEDKPVVQQGKDLSFRQALVIELLNPKTALFFLAFLPQFVQNDGLPVNVQLLMLGLTFVLMSILYTSTLVFLSTALGGAFFLKSKPKTNWLGKGIGIVYISLGLRLAFQTRVA
ncbi:LysE family translocator [Rossellomorea aquimaris]|uniref:LysE family translocator n=1 Tax=Rossellomorea aquimaris TaxID=189382 RepID=UPI001CD71E58|nr:LysE family translocator [Rossellomorea aquimaris]MCA1060568.1 LysE family translocator [Rossellomorea aquimaris]